MNWNFFYTEKFFTIFTVSILDFKLSSTSKIFITHLSILFKLTLSFTIFLVIKFFQFINASFIINKCCYLHRTWDYLLFNFEFFLSCFNIFYILLISVVGSGNKWYLMALNLDRHRYYWRIILFQFHLLSL